MRIFLDANVLFSVAKTDGAVRALVHLLVDGGHECWVDEYVVTEARRNLGAKGREAMAAFEALLPYLKPGSMTRPLPDPELLDWLPEKDRPVLAAAMRLQCDALVTADATHFGSAYGKVFGGVTIHSPRSMAEALLD